MELEIIKSLKNKIEEQEVQKELETLEKIILISNLKKGKKSILKQIFPTSKKLNQIEQQLYTGKKRGRKPKPKIEKPKREIIVERNVILEF
jgi:hypothetical protein